MALSQRGGGGSLEIHIKNIQKSSSSGLQNDFQNRSAATEKMSLI